VLSLHPTRDIREKIQITFFLHQEKKVHEKRNFETSHESQKKVKIKIFFLEKFIIFLFLT